MKQDSLKEIEKGLREYEEKKENIFIDDEKAMDESQRALYLNRMDFVNNFMSNYLKEKTLDLGCKNCQDCLEESCKLIRGNPMSSSECKKAGLKIEGHFDKDYNFKFELKLEL